MLLAEIYEEAGVPAGVFNLVFGPGSEVGATLVDSPDVRAISFTGSNAVGMALYAQAARRGAKVTCEMGGKNAVVVLPDAEPGEGRDRDLVRRLRLDRPALHGDLARGGASRRSRAS